MIPRLEEPIPLEPLIPPEITATLSLESLAPDHLDTLKQAIQNILATDVAKFTYAQIIDGLPTTSSFRDFHILYRDSDNPVQYHIEVCDGAMDRTRALISEFDPLSLRFEPHVVQDFQNQKPGSRVFDLRLVELVAVACHQIAVFLYETEGEKHRSEYSAWVAKQRLLREAEKEAGIKNYKCALEEPPAVFYHGSYLDYEQYPHGASDMVGYWAEAKIFGGAVLFDRSDSDENSKEVFFNEARQDGPRTIYPLTAEQFDILTNFLKSPTEDMACPLPIHGTKDNRPRYDCYHATKYFHIYRNRYEQRLPERFWGPCTRSSRDYPEIEDQMSLLSNIHIMTEDRTPEDEAALIVLQERLKKISPSSPLWGYDPRYA